LDSFSRETEPLGAIYCLSLSLFLDRFISEVLSHVITEALKSHHLMETREAGTQSESLRVRN
jgi:hypothetical protein